ncbi:MAG: SEC-C metal-binding domain-containing protein [Desulfohalobiaceae bacterium]
MDGNDSCPCGSGKK